MKREYTVLFKEVSGKEYEFTFLTDNIQESINQYSRNRTILSHEIIEEGKSNNKQILFG